MKISIIVASSINNVIGHQGTIPWYIPADLRRFKEITNGHHVLMGRKTYESIGRPLPNRINEIVTKDNKYHPEGIFVFTNIQDAVEFAKTNKETELFVIGGQNVYEATLNIANRIYQTLILTEYKGDIHFPQIDSNIWKETFREEHLNETPPYVFRNLERI